MEKEAMPNMNQALNRSKSDRAEAAAERIEAEKSHLRAANERARREEKYFSPEGMDIARAPISADAKELLYGAVRSIDASEYMPPRRDNKAFSRTSLQMLKKFVDPKSGMWRAQLTTGVHYGRETGDYGGLTFSRETTYFSIDLFADSTIRDPYLYLSFDSKSLIVNEPTLWKSVFKLLDDNDVEWVDLQSSTESTGRY